MTTCEKCGKRPCYRRGGKVYRLCSMCGMDALVEFLSEPELGTRAICSLCDKEIEYIGPYWRHRHGTPRHIPVPKGFFKEKCPPENARALLEWMRGES